MKAFTLCGKKIELFWYNLTLLLVPTILTLTFVYQDENGMIYVPFSCGISALIIFLNFPSIVILLHSRPIYFDDLIIKNYEGDGHIYDEIFRKKYQKMFVVIASCTSAIMVGVTVELWFFRDDTFNNNNDDSAGDQTVNSFVVLGIIGGLLRIYYAATMILGRGLLTLLKKLKRKEQERLRRNAEERTLVELSGMGVTITDTDDQVHLINENNDRSEIGMRVVGLKPTIMADIFN